MNVKGYVCLTTLDETLPLHCVEAKKPGLFFCYTKSHVQVLEKQLVRRIFKCMQMRSSPLFEPNLADDIKKLNPAYTAPKGEGESGETPKDRPKRPITTPSGSSSKRPKKTPGDDDKKSVEVREALLKRLNDLGNEAEEEDDEGDA